MFSDINIPDTVVLQCSIAEKVVQPSAPPPQNSRLLIFNQYGPFCSVPFVRRLFYIVGVTVNQPKTNKSRKNFHDQHQLLVNNLSGLFRNRSCWKIFICYDVMSTTMTCLVTSVCRKSLCTLDR